jgi:predicted RNA-binding protein Jag
LTQFQSQSDVAHFLRHILGAAALDLQFNIEAQSNLPSRWVIRFSGQDVPMLTANDGKLLNALGHLIVENFDFAEVRAGLSSIVLAGTRWQDAETHTL